MTDQSLFNDGEQQEQAPVSDANPYADQLQEIVAEDGRQKYADIPTALQGLKASQEYIAKLEAENARAREELAQRASVEEALSKLGEQQPQAQATSLPDIKGLVSEQLQALEAQKQKQNNLSIVQNEMLSKYGDAEKAEQAFQARAQELGVNSAFLLQVAATSPKAAKDLLGLNAGTTTLEKQHSSINTQGLNGTPEPIERKGVMRNASTKDLVEQWRRHKPNM